MKDKWTGERLETFIYDETTIEHLHRYAIALDMVKDKIVLDVACGEGYGSNLLAARASMVTGADIDQLTIEKAKKKYRKTNLHFVEAPVQRLPFDAESFDVVVSFETLEHITAQEKMLSECKRVLRPGGLLLVSTPDKTHYSDENNYINPYHLKELNKQTFVELISKHFLHYYLIEQRLMIASVAVTQAPATLAVYEGDYESIHSTTRIKPHYIIALASDAIIIAPASSVFTSNAVLETALRERESILKNTITYRLGNLLLFPFKWIGGILKRKPA